MHIANHLIEKVNNHQNESVFSDFLPCLSTGSYGIRKALKTQLNLNMLSSRLVTCRRMLARPSPRTQKLCGTEEGDIPGFSFTDNISFFVS